MKVIGHIKNVEFQPGDPEDTATFYVHILASRRDFTLYVEMKLDMSLVESSVQAAIKNRIVIAAQAKGLNLTLADVRVF